MQAIDAIDADIRQVICSTVIVTGGCLNTPGLQERMKKELNHHLSEKGVHNINFVMRDITTSGANAYLNHVDYNTNLFFVNDALYRDNIGDISKLIL